jgi:hypothetical protein
MKAIILTPADPDIGDADYLAWVRSERDILADDIAAAGGRLVAATAFVCGEPGIRALMLTRTVDASTEIIGATGALAIGCDLGVQMREEVNAFAYSQFARLAHAGNGGMPIPCHFEMTFGREVLVRSDAKGASILPRDDADR